MNWKDKIDAAIERMNAMSADDFAAKLISAGYNPDGSDEEKEYCNCCGDELVFGRNVFSSEGWKEYEISGLCEVCFDYSTFSVEENLNDECEWVKLVQNTDGLILAGGYMRKLVDSSDTLEDIDLFFTDISAVEKVKEYLVSKSYGNIFTCPQGKLFTYHKDGCVKVQLILKRSYIDLEDVVNSFDITACCAGYDGKRMYYNKRFVSDVLNKIIAFNIIEYPVATLGRILKYKDKGYSLKWWAREDYVKVVNSMVLDSDNVALYID